MQKNIRRISATIFLTLISLLTVAAQEVTVDSLKYTLNTTDHTASVTGYVDGIKHVEIPSAISIDGVQYNVTSVAAHSFENYYGLQSVILSGNVRTTALNSFCGCRNLKSVTLNEGLEELGEGCFGFCAIDSITLPASLKKINRLCFYQCSKLHTITCLAQIPPTCDIQAFVDISYSNNVNVRVYDVDMYKASNVWSEFSQFSNIGGTTTVTIDSLKYTLYTSNHTASVMGCVDGVKDATISSSIIYEGVAYNVIAVASHSFENNLGLQSVKIPGSVRILGVNSFAGCKNIKSVTFEEGLENIGKGCFSRCESLTTITLPSTVTILGDYCFAESGLHSATCLAKTPPACGMHPFDQYCIIYVDDVEPYKADENWGELPIYRIGDLIVNVTGFNYKLLDKTGEATLIRGKYSGDVTIPSKIEYKGSEYNVVALDESSFCDCSQLNSVKIPEGVKSIGDKCFSRCYSLTSINIPNGVTSLGNKCFYICSNLMSIDIPSSVTSLGDECFYECDSLTSINIPNGVTSLGNECFGYCMNLMSIDIPSSVISIGDECFRSCSSLTSIEIPDSVTKIEDYCFCGCSSLKSIKLPDGLRSIGRACFVNVGSAVSPCKLYISDKFDTNLLSAEGSYYKMEEGYFLVQVQGIKLSATHLNVIKGRDFSQVSATVVPAVANDKRIKVTSLDTAVASIENKDSIIINNLGEADIRYESLENKDAYAICHVKVFAHADSIKLEKKAIELVVTHSFKLGYTVYPSNGWPMVKMVSDNEQIAKVKGDTIYAVGIGTANIIVSSTDSANVRAVCGITVVPLKVDSIALDVTSFKLYTGGTAKINATVFPDLASNKELKWTSDNEQVATVKDGTVTAVSEGIANITASATDGSGISAVCMVNVYDIKVDSIVLDTTSLKLPAGRTVKINATVLPSLSTNKDLEWTSDNEQVATVKDGNVTTVGVGTAHITVSATDGSGITAVCTVVVTANVDNFVSELNNKVAYAQTLHDQNQEGKNVGNYPVGTRNALQDVIDAVKEKISDTMSKNDVLDCYDKLQAAIDDFEAKRIECNRVQLNLNDRRTVSFALSESISIKCTPTTITFANVEYPKSEVEYISYWYNIPSTDIDNVRGSENKNDVLFHVTNDGIKADGLAKEERVNIYTIDGHLVCTGRADSDGSVTLRLESLQKQVYIVKTSSGISYKFIKR